MTAVLTDGFVEALRAQSQAYHDQHPFHVRMNSGKLSRRQLQGWVANVGDRSSDMDFKGLTRSTSIVQGYPGHPRIDGFNAHDRL